MFDCVLPTRNGRHGMAFTRFGPINLANARHANDPRPLDEESAHPAARTYSRAYLHHLIKANEMLGAMLLSTINLAYYQTLMARHARGDRGRALCRISGRRPRPAGRRAICQRSEGCLAGCASLKPAHECARLSLTSSQAAFQASIGHVRCPLPRLRAGREISLCAEPALHAGGCAEGNARRAACASRHRTCGHRAGELPRHRQCGDARLHCVGSEALSRRRDRQRRLHRQGFRQARSPAACAAFASIS